MNEKTSKRSTLLINFDKQMCVCLHMYIHTVVKG
uniref:Uncharacterized protein n=1 Tax=Rhizophora mucronata TaxID=61149 RepID=A0A2P2QW88_RHIMU